MKNIELEEGEAYYFRDDDDDDENVDPDRHFSYIDQKVENLLGHYRKDFMCGYSAEYRGPRYGDYGSFLPMYERPAPLLPHLRSQSHVSPKSPPNLSSEENPTVAANTSLPAISNDQTGKYLLDSGISTVNNQLKVQKSAECASNLQHQPKKPIIHQSAQNSLKFTVKRASESMLSGDKTAIYSGLGLDMSPMSSPEGTPLECGRTFHDFQKIKPESPSFIIKIMTSAPLLNEALISPLHDDLLCLMELDKTLETSLPIIQAEPLKIILDNAYLEGMNEASNERKPMLKDSRKENSSKKNEANVEFPSNFSDFGAIRREEMGTLVGNKIVANTPINAVGGRSKETGKFSDLRPSVVFDKKSEIGGVIEGMDSYMKPVELAIVLPDAALVEDEKLSEIRNKYEDGKNKIANSKVEPGTYKRNEFGRREDEANKFLKQHSVLKDIMKEEDVVSGCPSEADDYRKESVKQEMIAKDKEASLVSANDVKANNKHVDIRQEMKQHYSVYFESSKQKSCVKVMSHLQTGPNLEEPPSSLVKKKLNDRQIGNAFSTKPVRGGIVNSSGQEAEDVFRNLPSKNTKGNINLPMGMRKDGYVAVIEDPSKKGNEVSSRKIVMGPSVRDEQPSARKMKEQLTRKINGFVNTRPKVEGHVHVAGGNFLNGRFPVGELPPPENGSLVPLEMEDWVQCEKCEKWRLLPFGRNPNSLPKEWICSMLTWLPGMNKCSVSEDETTQGLRALYLPSALGSALQVQNNQRTHLDGITSVKASSGAQNVGLCTSGMQMSAQDLHRPIKKDPEPSVGVRNPKNLNKLPLEKPCAAAGAGRPSKVPKKRMAEAEVSGVPKKMKNLRQQSMERPIVLGLLTPETYGGSSELIPSGVKNKGRSVIIATNDAANDVPKKRKLKDQQQNVEASEHFGNGQHPLNNLVTGNNSGTERRKEIKISTSNSEARNSSADKGHDRTKVNAHKNILVCAADSHHKVSRVERYTLDPYHADQVSRKTADARNSSEKALDLGLSDNGTTSSSSKVSKKVRAKASEVKCSPGGSISSSPMKVCKSDPVKGTNKVVVSYYEPEELSAGKRLKSSVEGADASRELEPHNEEIKGRKSNLSRISGLMSDAAHEDNFSGKMSCGRQSSAHTEDSQPKLQDFDRPDGKLDHRHHEGGTVALQRNVETRLPNGLHFDGTSSESQNLLAPEMVGRKELSVYTHPVSDFEKGSGSNSVRVDNGTGKISRQVSDDQLGFRHPHHTAHASKDIEVSSSKKMNNFHTAAKTALKEAKDLKHSANRLKTAGSRLSTRIFFQAALKFLHGASLLEPGTNENGRIGEMMPTEVYSSTAKLCEYCAHEYEKCNDMASAALAYKCMEVAYMRVVYYNDVAASRDRVEVQMAVRAAPQVDSPSSSASDIDNLNNQLAIDPVRDGHSVMDHRSHVISARNRPNFVRLLSYTHDINLAMEASRRSQSAFAVANPILSQEGNEDGISSIKRVLDFSFHDVGGLLHLVRLSMEALNN